MNLLKTVIFDLSIQSSVYEMTYGGRMNDKYDVTLDAATSGLRTGCAESGCFI